MAIDVDTRKAALLAHLRAEGEDDITEDDMTASRFTAGELELGERGWLVLTEEEAYDAACADIAESLWAFNPSFLTRYIDELTDAQLAKVAKELYEDATPVFRALIGDRWDELVHDAIAEDGRGHFLASYDDEEYEVEHDGQTFYVYRTN